MIGFIGGGNMASALIKGMADAGMASVMVSEPDASRLAPLVDKYGAKAAASNTDLVKQCNIIVLAVKPQIMETVLDEISPAVDNSKTIVSIAAGITLKFLQSKLRCDKIVRVMPNVCSLNQQGMAVMSLCDCFTGSEINQVKEILMASGRLIALPERQMDAVTALSGSGPAFIALFIKCMMDAGVSLGLDAESARELATQTLVGTAGLLDGELNPDGLIRMVKSPGGTTAAGLAVFEAEGLAEVVSKALEAAAKRSRELAK